MHEKGLPVSKVSISKQNKSNSGGHRSARQRRGPRPVVRVKEKRSRVDVRQGDENFQDPGLRGFGEGRVDVRQGNENLQDPGL